ncbi:MAG: sulfite exporter TauE/SafE family protein [Candidatus Obscuribacterales bacterium]
MDLLFYTLIGIVACLYSAVGHGGATGYLAVMSIYQVDQQTMAGSALILNCLTASIALAAYWGAGYLSLSLSLPFILVSIPFAFLGALCRPSDSQYSLLLALVLILASARLLLLKTPPGTADRFVRRPALKIVLPVGALLGFLAGAVGIGGGVFLSPVIILSGWADTRTTSATAALFIVANSLAGLCARLASGSLEYGEMAPLLAVALAGSLLGSWSATRLSTSEYLRRLLAAVLVIAAFKSAIQN